MKIFPAHLTKDGQKVPLINGWREKASSDPNQHKLWQEFFRDRINFYGIPTGSINGFFVLDVDTKKQNGWETLQQMSLQVPATLMQYTPSGGAHFLFRHDPSREIGNKVGFLPGLDIRSEGGWIAYYNFVDSGYSITDAPEWLYEHANKKKEPVINQSQIKISPEIAQNIFEESLELIRNAPEGESNNVLNIEAYKVGQLLASGVLTREFAEIELFKAAKDRGKPDYESKATIKSGLDGGLKNPLTSPFPNTEPVSNIVIPSPINNERWTPRYLTREDLMNVSKLKKPQLFENWSTEDIHITTADGGTGKTTLKLFEAICLAVGDPFLGFKNVQRGKTLFITGEDTDLKLAAMIGAILKAMNYSEDVNIIETVLSSIIIKKDADLTLITKDKQGFLHPNRDAMTKVMQAVDDFQPKMIVFDPISSFWGSESALNDMNKAVTKFMGELMDRSGACVEMINHMGKSSSATKDMSQFAGRGGSGLPSNSRVSRVLRYLPPEEFVEMTGGELVGDQTAMICNVNKFSDGSPLFNKPFIIIREGYLFKRMDLSEAKIREVEKQMQDTERIFTFVKQQRGMGRYPTRKVITGFFMNQAEPMSEGRIKRALDLLGYIGHLGEKLIEIDNPDASIRDRALVVADMDGKEL